ncbi:hypothetical protein JTB14_030029 [Gonioctena quinquepunctata]|nr:hypothetical protein JTB14_030029 [Gonioctena quinquepunctata]
MDSTNVTHAIDLACTNAWLEYRKQAEVLNTPRKEVLDLVHFRSYIADVLIKAGKTPSKKRGRPSSETSTPPGTPTLTRRKVSEKRPLQEVRLDGVNIYCS